MRGYISILVFLFFTACAPVGEVVEVKELRINFEDRWWEITDPPSWLANSDNIFCVCFNTDYQVKPPDDGVVLWQEEGDAEAHVLDNFERAEDGYYLPEHDVDLEVLVDEDGNYFAKVSLGLFSNVSEIIPCSL
jgi:hypothetical protein